MIETHQKPLASMLSRMFPRRRSGVAQGLSDKLPPPAPDATAQFHEAPLDAAGGLLEVRTFALFFSYCRINAIFVPKDDFVAPNRPGGRDPRVHLTTPSVMPPQKSSCVHLDDHPGAYEIIVEAMVDRAMFPDSGSLDLAIADRSYRFSLSYLMTSAVAFNVRSLRAPFEGAIATFIAEHSTPVRRPKLLDIGGRARSDNRYSRNLAGCDVTVFDILPDHAVDVVGDAHELSSYFPEDAFDFAVCISVFEHLLMPWKVAVELGRVMKTGGLILIHTHQTTGMHDLPWDFWRYSDTSWHGLFNKFTGFEIVETSLSNWMHIVPRAWQTRYSLAEKVGGFDSSSVIVRKIGGSRVQWDVRLPDVLGTSYPTHADNSPV